jgi:hypothetical protein
MKDACFTGGSAEPSADRHDRHHSSVRLESTPGSLQRFSADCIKHYIYAVNAVFEAMRLIVDYLFGAELGYELSVGAEIVAMTCTPCSRANWIAKTPTGPAPPAMNEHALSSAEPGRSKRPCQPVRALIGTEARRPLQRDSAEAASEPRYTMAQRRSPP